MQPKRVRETARGDRETGARRNVDRPSRGRACEELTELHCSDPKKDPRETSGQTVPCKARGVERCVPALEQQSLLRVHRTGLGG